MQKFEEVLHTSKYHMTLPRRHMFSLLAEADIPMSVSSITSELRTVDRSTVYRTLELFLKLDIIKKVWFGNQSKYELSDDFQDHHHHLVCERCGLITKIDSKDLEKTLFKLTKKAGYKHTRHQVEIIGLCADHR